jgi:PAS domain S-box-containing protein
MTYFIDHLPWFFVVILAIFVVDLLVSFFKLKSSHENLKEEHSRKALLLNSIAEGVYGLDLHGNCTFCNSATLKLLGYRHETELVGRNVHDLIHHTRADGSRYPAEDCKACLAYKKNQEVHLEDELLWRQDGSCFQAEYWSYPVRKGNRLVGAVVSFVDITQRKEVEERLIAANRELDAFVYTVSHDLRSPIAAVTGYVDLLRENHHSELSSDAMELLGTIEKQGYKMALLVDDLLALAKVGNLPTPAEPVDSNRALRDVVEELAGEMGGTGGAVTAGELPSVRIPDVLLGQIFQNLVGNALRYAGACGKPVEVGGQRLGARVRFYVRDHGQGVPESERERIFEAFYRGSTGQGLMGSGIGLATVRKIAQRHNGRAWVEETPGGGATFWVELEG